ncbi:Fc receptor-like protein 5 isoform X2 [Trachinotus anak]|uniref:Fc receptor-like protein 5 isoform X2 n=1 Tax=Trachinotus anak TaxID=443729 RepID=UPI0039F1A75E
MRGAAMSLTAASGGFVVVLLLAVTVIEGQTGWGVTYTSTQICAFKGSTVEINCTYTYPDRINTAVKETLWFTKSSGNEPVDLRTDSEYSGRVQYHCGQNACTLTITDLRESDSAEYKFRFTTNRPGGKYTGSPGVTLSVTGLQVQVIEHNGKTELKCHSNCHLPERPSIIWYQSGQITGGETPSFSGYFYPEDSYSCALKGHEDFHSPLVCVSGQSCNRVTYTDRRICASKGSSVDISCSYNSDDDENIESKFWFSPEHSRCWQNPSQPEDLIEDSQYSGRVQVLDAERGRSTLRISDLRERDSAQYHFKFKTPNFEWESSLPGTTLTVTALEVQLTRIITAQQSYTEAELKCLSSCSPAGRLSYVWFKNGEKITEEESSYKDRFYPGDMISCALKGHESYGSPSVYALKVPSVSVNPPNEIMEGISVTLTCDTNPAANFTWYKENQPLVNKEAQLVFSSIQSSDSGHYHCAAENQLGRRTSESIFIHVEYPPKLPSVSVSPSGEIVEGSSVTLTCSSDANPAAKYTWYKENEDSPKASGQIFTITELRPEHSGNYYCEAQNTRGRHSSTLHQVVVGGAWKLIVIATVSAIVLAFIPISVFLWIIKRRVSEQGSEPGPDDREQMQPGEQQDDLHYASVHFSKDHAVYSNIRPAQPRRHKEKKREEEEMVTYAAVTFNSGSGAPRSRGQEAPEDPAALYSTVNKPCKKK